MSLLLLSLLINKLSFCILLSNPKAVAFSGQSSDVSQCRRCVASSGSHTAIHPLCPSCVFLLLTALVLSVLPANENSVSWPHLIARDTGKCNLPVCSGAKRNGLVSKETGNKVPDYCLSFCKCPELACICLSKSLSLSNH